MFSTRTGFACDSVVEFEVVLSSGDLVRANAKERPDLWVALKGGLNNFGIVTSFKMNTMKSGNIWGGVTYYMPGTFNELLQRACDFVHNEADIDTHIMCSAGYGFGHQAVSCVMYHTGGVENPHSLKRFTSIEPQISQMCTMRTAKHVDFCDELSKFSTDGIRFVSSIHICFLYSC
jgi:FAD/FMN-containing dehydrogenase